MKMVKEGLKPVKEKLSAGSVLSVEGSVNLTITNNINNQLGIGMNEGNIYIQTYRTIDELNKMFEMLGYKIVTTKYLNNLKTRAKPKKKKGESK